MSAINEMQKVPLNKGQRIGVALLGILTLGIVLVTVLQFRGGLYEFASRKKTGSADFLDPAVQQQNEIDRLKKSDTDRDGLSDYDELSVYHSSPYLRDTDSDGIPDGEEVQRGTSPVCPEGKDCSLNPLYVSPKNGTVSPTPDLSPAKPAPSNLTPDSGFAAAGPSVDTTAADIQKVREMLLQDGVKKDQLDKLTDEELMQLLIEAQQNQQNKQNGGTSVNTLAPSAPTNP